LHYFEEFHNATRIAGYLFQTDQFGKPVILPVLNDFRLDVLVSKPSKRMKNREPH